MQLDELATNPTTVLKDDGKPVNPQLEQAIKEAFLGACHVGNGRPRHNFGSRQTKSTSERLERTGQAEETLILCICLSV